MTKKFTLEEIEQAALESAANMGAAKDMFVPGYGWILKDGKTTEAGIEFYKVHQSETDIPCTDHGCQNTEAGFFQCPNHRAYWHGDAVLHKGCNYYALNACNKCGWCRVR